MKKISTALFAYCLLLTATALRAQISFTVSPNLQCYANGNNTVVAAITVSTIGTTNYTWSITSNTCSANYTLTAGNGSIIVASLPCVGTYTFDTYAMNGTSLITTATQVVTINPVPVITATALPGNTPNCAGTTFTVVPGGGMTYSINAPGFTFTPLSSGCVTVTGSNSSGCLGFATTCYTVQPNPTLTVNGSNSVCAGGVSTLVAAGAMNYTWQPGGLVGSTIVVSPSVSTCYTLFGGNASGCTSSAPYCITVLAHPTLVAIGVPSFVCVGNTATLSAMGASSYTWVPGSIVFSTAVVTPSVPTCYTVFGSNSFGCTSFTTACIGVNSLPSISISGNSVSCSGQTNTITASGANTYAWSNGVAGSSIVVTSTSTICYSVHATGLNGCSIIASHCLSVSPGPSLSIAGNNSVCLGSSLNFTASGANSYTWNTNPAVNTVTLSLIPGNSFTYQVIGTGSNGCTGTATLASLVNTACAIVWPGDANRDGLVSNTDVFEIGLAFNAAGPARTTTSNAWASQFANNWTGTISTGWNRNHADCNGDGSINNADTVAIFNNFSLTHAFKAVEHYAVNPDITLSLPATVYAGQWNKADILLGSASAPISQLYGIAFDLGIDPTLLDNNSAYLLYTPSFLNANNQNVEFRKNNLTNGIIHAASVRVDGNNSNGNGKIGELWFKLSATAPNNALLNLSANNGVKINSSGTSSALTTGTASAVVAIDVGIKESGGFLRNLSVYPNPASNQVSLQNTSGFSVAYNIVDVLGREVLKGEFVGIKTLDVSSLGQGAYFIKFESAGTSVHKKLVIEK